MKSIHLLKLVVVQLTAFSLLYLASCETPVDTTLEELEQARQDSIALSQADSIILDQYIEEFGLNKDEIVVLDRDVRYLVENPTGSTQEFKPSDLVSLHLDYKFDDGFLFYTTNEAKAVELDSLSWLDRWNDEADGGEAQSFLSDTLFIGASPADTVLNAGREIEDVLTDLSQTKEPLDYTRYSSGRTYIPQVVNYTTDGSGLISNWPIGLRAAMTDALPKMRMNSMVTVLCPSTVGFGVQGSGIVPPNTVVIFEISVVNIRP